MCSQEKSFTVTINASSDVMRHIYAMCCNFVENAPWEICMRAREWQGRKMKIARTSHTERFLGG